MDLTDAFPPIAKSLKNEFETIGQPLVMNFRVNAGFIPKDHWTQNPQLGGGRIIGEMCHFIDLMQFFTNSRIESVYASCINVQNSEITNEDNISVILKFSDGSVGNLVYLANGDKSMPKERLEIFGGGKIGVIHDFRYGEIFKNNKTHKLSLSGKGHKQEVFEFLDSIKNGTECPITFDSINNTTLATFKIIDSLSTGNPQYL